MPDVVDAPRRLPGGRFHHVRDALSGAGQALAFLTVVPVRVAGSGGPLAGGAAVAAFPVVGALVGGLAGGMRAGAGELVGSLPATVLAVATLVAVTGALHQDGLADVADALGARGGRERRLAVMRDPVNGTFGTLALICWALLVVSAVAALPAVRALRALVVACMLGRSGAVVHATLLAPARADGLGAAFAPRPPAVILSAAIAAGAAVLAVGPSQAALAVASVAVVVLAVTIASRRLFGGRTGDTLGASVAVAEAFVCLALLAGWR